MCIPTDKREVEASTGLRKCADKKVKLNLLQNDMVVDTSSPRLLTYTQKPEGPLENLVRASVHVTRSYCRALSDLVRRLGEVYQCQLPCRFVAKAPALGARRIFEGQYSLQTHTCRQYTRRKHHKRPGGLYL